MRAELEQARLERREDLRRISGLEKAAMATAIDFEESKAGLQVCKRALYRPQKSPMSAAKEPYVGRKRALCQPQKSPVSAAKEPYVSRERALLQP